MKAFGDLDSDPGFVHVQFAQDAWDKSDHEEIRLSPAMRRREQAVDEDPYGIAFAPSRQIALQTTCLPLRGHEPDERRHIAMLVRLDLCT